MKFLKSTLTLLFVGALFIMGCSDSENECVNTCPTGQIQTLTCNCVTDANTIVPHPCPDLTCPGGQVVGVNGNTCSCVEPATEVCGGMTCTEGEVLDAATCECIEIVEQFGSVTVSDNITGSVTWTANNIYTLGGRIAVVDGATLTIEAGTVIKGATGTGTQASALVVAQGGQIMAMGTAAAPIIMTSILDDVQPGQTNGSNLDEEENGLWGGLLVLGRAPISIDGDGLTAQIEGIPADDVTGLYGGTDAADNSGILQYVSVRHGGAVIGSDNEINGITLGGVGNGTVIENIEVAGNKDDGIEWFGGTVNVTNALVWAADDDALDVDQAYSGTIDNAVVIAFSGTDHGLEIDGPEGSLGGECTIINVTIKGADDELGNYRDGASAVTSNVYFFGFEKIADGEGDLALDDATTLGTAKFSNLEIVLTADATAITDMLKNGIDAFGTVVTEGANTVGANTSVFDWTYAKAAGALNF